MDRLYSCLSILSEKIEDLKKAIQSKSFACQCGCDNKMDWTLIICVLGGILIISIFASIIVGCIRKNDLRKEQFNLIRSQINRVGSSSQENDRYEILVSALGDI